MALMEVTKVLILKSSPRLTSLKSVKHDFEDLAQVEMIELMKILSDLALDRTDSPHLRGCFKGEMG